MDSFDVIGGYFKCWNLFPYFLKKGDHLSVDGGVWIVLVLNDT